MPINGVQKSQISDALIHAYDESSLQRMVRTRLDTRLDQVAGGKNFTIIVDSLIDWAEREGRVQQLVKQAYSENSTNQKLTKLFDDSKAWFLPKPSLIRVAPYKGMNYFDVEDTDLFFGRDALSMELAEYAKQHSFLVIVGASGSGKSSLVRAGIVPHLVDRESVEKNDRFSVHIMTPTEQPLQALATTLTRNDKSSLAPTLTLLDDLAQDTRSLDLYITRLLTQSDAPKKLLLIIDQFEELFTLCHSEDERQAFVKNLLVATNSLIKKQSTQRLYLILTIRADFYAHCLKFADFRDALESHQKIIGVMTEEEMRSAIEGPAAQQWNFQSGLIEQMLSDVGYTETGEPEPGSLPLLSHALRETWEQRSHNTMTLAGYRAIGGVKGAIAQTAQDTFESLNAQEQLVARNIFLRLTELGEGYQDTRRRVNINEFDSQATDSVMTESVLNLLAKRRLIVKREMHIEVAHEALIHEWTALREWLDENREWLRLHRRLGADAQDWRKSDDNGVLYRGTRLKHIQSWAKQYPSDLNDLEEKFLLASQKAIDDETRAQKKTSHKLRRREVLLVLLLLLSLWFAVAERRSANLSSLNEQAANSAREKLEQEARRTSSMAMAALAQNQIQKNSVASDSTLLLARASVLSTWEEEGYVIPEADRALREAYMSATQHLVLPIDQHRGSVNAIAWHPSKLLIASGGDDNTIRIWDVESAVQKEVFTGHFDKINSLSWSPNGTSLVSGSQDGTVRIWDTENGEMVLLFDDQSILIRSVAWSPDGRFILAGGTDNLIRIWDAQKQSIHTTLEGHTETVMSVAWSPDGQHIASGSWDKTVRIWKTETGQAFQIFKGHKEGVNTVSWSPDGLYVVSGGRDDAVTVWNATDGNIYRTFQDSLRTVNSIAWSPESDYIAIGKVDMSLTNGFIEVWNIDNGDMITSFNSHLSGVKDVTWSTDGRYILSGETDGAVRVWNIQDGQTAIIPNDHTDAILSVSWSPNDQYFVSSSINGATQIWDIQNGRNTFTQQDNESFAYAVDWSPDGKYIASGSNMGLVHVWNVQSGQTELYHFRSELQDLTSIDWGPNSDDILAANAFSILIFNLTDRGQVKSLEGHSELISSVAWSPDGQQIIGGGDDTVYIWSAKEGTLSQTFDAPSNSANILEWSPSGKYILAGGTSSVIYILDAQNGQIVNTLRGHTDTITSVAWSPDEQRILSGSFDTTVRVWDAQNGHILQVFEEQTSVVNTVAWSPDGERAISGGADQTIHVWHVDDSQPRKITEEHTSDVNSVVYSPDGQYFASGSRDNSIYITDAQSGERIAELVGHIDSVNSLAWSPDGQKIISGSGYSILSPSPSPYPSIPDNTIRIWSVKYGKLIRIIEGHFGRVSSVNWSPDGHRILSGSDDGSIRIWSADNGQLIKVIEDNYPYEMYSVAWSPDGQSILSGGWDGNIRIWNAESGDLVNTIEAHPFYKIKSVAWSPDGRRILTGSSDNSIRIWNVNNGQLVHKMEGHTDWVNSTVWSSDGERVLSGSDDSTIRIWNADSGLLTQTIEGHQGPVNSVAWSPDGQHILSGSNDNAAQVWMSTELLLARVESYIQRPSWVFTPSERSKYALPDEISSWLATIPERTKSN